MDYTVITGFLKVNDNEGFGHSLDEYRKRSNFSLNLDVNMVIFCDDFLFEHITQTRKKFENKTVIVKVDYQSMKYSKYADQIKENRFKNQKNYPDPRNTPNYFCTTMNKFDMIERAINQNPFESTHFAWIDFGYNQKDAIPDLLYENLKLEKDRFSCCLIDYVSRNVIANPKEYYQNGGPPTVAAGFFTANKEIFLKICSLIYEEFIDVINKGYGHAEQQLMYVLMIKYFELFDVYPGDYYSILLNYKKPVDLNTPYRCLIPRLYQYGDNLVLKHILDRIVTP